MREQERKKETSLTSKVNVEKHFSLQPGMREVMAVETLEETRCTVMVGRVTSAMLHWLSKKTTIVEAKTFHVQHNQCNKPHSDKETYQHLVNSSICNFT